MGSCASEVLFIIYAIFLYNCSLLGLGQGAAVDQCGHVNDEKISFNSFKCVNSVDLYLSLVLACLWRKQSLLMETHCYHKVIM